jgi:hypothetical protein
MVGDSALCTPNKITADVRQAIKAVDMATLRAFCNPDRHPKVESAKPMQGTATAHPWH